MGDVTDPMAGLTPAQAARAHVQVARELVIATERHTGGKWTTDQGVALAQVQATLAVASALLATGPRREDGCPAAPGTTGYVHISTVELDELRRRE